MSYSFTVRTSGRCNTVLSLEECKQFQKSNFLVDFPEFNDVRSMDPESDTLSPRGCWVWGKSEYESYTNALFYETDADGVCSRTRQCICAEHNSLPTERDVTDLDWFERQYAMSNLKIISIF